MINIIRIAEKRFAHTISLTHLLGGTETPFRSAVLGVLVQDGFELDEPLPGLQHPVDLLKALSGLEGLGFETAWPSFRQVLQDAGRLGILVDVSVRRTKPHRMASCLRPGQKPAGMFHPLEPMQCREVTSMIHVEYRYPWTGPRWRRYGSARHLDEALDLLDACRENHPGGECRIREDRDAMHDQA